MTSGNKPIYRYTGYWVDTEGYCYDLDFDYFTFDAVRQACYRMAEECGVKFSRGIIG